MSKNMSKTYIWSDLHFSHFNIIRYTGRPYTNVEDMDSALITAWKETVQQNDTIINLGDVFFKKPQEDCKRIIGNLPGKKILILGNHDRSKSVKWWREIGFHEVYEHPIVLEGRFILSHEPMKNIPVLPYINIHGHTHEKPSDHPNRINVSVEQIGYKPILFNELVKVM